MSAISRGGLRINDNAVSYEQKQKIDYRNGGIRRLRPANRDDSGRVSTIYFAKLEEKMCSRPCSTRRRQSP